MIYDQSIFNMFFNQFCSNNITILFLETYLYSRKIKKNVQTWNNLIFVHAKLIATEHNNLKSSKIIVNSPINLHLFLWIRCFITILQSELLLKNISHHSRSCTFCFTVSNSLVIEKSSSSFKGCGSQKHIHPFYW